MTKLVFPTSVVALTVTLFGAAGASAQTPPPEAGVSFERNVDIKIDGAGAGTFGFMVGPVAFENETVTGAPYSAEAITEVVQPLPDGNRIVRQSKVELARDSTGRTRREQGLSVLGPMVNDPSDMRQVQITDPAAHTIILLDMQHRTAQKLPAPNVRLMTNGGQVSVSSMTTKIMPPGNEPPARGFETFEMAMPSPPEAFGGGVKMFVGAESRNGMPKPVVESLGKQFLEGVEAEGTRTTFTIPAGDIGNELPISVVSERWISPDLKLLVMSRQSDPRFGETTYRLTNIIRSEPPTALFEVPSDFTLVEPPHDTIFRKMTK